MVEPPIEWEEKQELILQTIKELKSNPNLNKINTEQAIKILTEELKYFKIYGKVLDVGCGEIENLITKLVGNEIEYWGIDPLNCGDKPNLIKGYAEDLSIFDNEVFDCVLCIASLNHFFDIDLALSEMKRVLKPKGKVCIAVGILNANDNHAHLITFTEESILMIINKYFKKIQYKYSHNDTSNIMIIAKS